LDGAPWQALLEGGSLTYSPVAVGVHELVLSNPCTSTHEPSVQSVVVAANDTTALQVTIPPECE
jgi:hypothetical protein